MTQHPEKKKPDYKFLFGMTIFVLVFAAIAGGFWYTVAKQAKLVKEEEARQEAEAISAIYVEAGDYLKQGYFVDMNTKTIFTADVPKEGIYNRNGKLIEDDVLENGDMVKVYGDGAMTLSLPGIYPNVTKMQRNGRATLEELQPYVDMIEEVLGRGSAS